MNSVLRLSIEHGLMIVLLAVRSDLVADIPETKHCQKPRERSAILRSRTRRRARQRTFWHSTRKARSRFGVRKTRRTNANAPKINGSSKRSRKGELQKRRLGLRNKKTVG